MYCPKCGTKNPESGKFCRKCGGDLPLLTGAKPDEPVVVGKPVNNAIEPAPDGKHRKKQEDTTSWELAMGGLFLGISFIIISVVLAFQPMGTGWWFWLLIPGFMMTGLGVAKIMRIAYGPETSTLISEGNPETQESGKEQASLPPKRTEFVSDVGGFRQEIGDLAPPSVAEGTTRNLEMDAEMEMKTPEEQPE